MKKLLLLLLFPFLAASAADAQSLGKKPRLKARHHYVHASESSKGKTSKARFRPVNNIKPTIDLHPRRLEKFKTAKVAKPYTWSKGY